MSIEELFGTLQQSVVSSWRKHLVTDKYSNHMALDEFYKEMPELVDKLIEDWMGVNGKVKDFKNLLDGSDKMTAIEYLNKLKKIVNDGRSLMKEKELEADLDDICSQIDSTLYKLKELKENNMSLSKYLKDTLSINEAKSIKLETFVLFDLQNDIYNVLGDLAFEYSNKGVKFDEKDVKKALDHFMKNFFVEIDESVSESKECFTCDKETIKTVMQELEDEGSDISIIQDILSGTCEDLDKIFKKHEKLLLKFAWGVNPNPKGNRVDIEGTIEAAKKTWNK